MSELRDVATKTHTMPSLPTFARKGKSRSPTGEGGGLGLVNREDWMGSVARFWQRSYMPDYLGLTFLVVAYIVVRIPDVHTP